MTIRGMAAFAAFLLFAFANPAEARHHRYHARHVATQIAYNCVSDNSGHQTCLGSVSHDIRHPRVTRIYDANGNTTIIGGRPAGCPHAYCGCGLARYLGLHDPRLNLAWNWARLFPREYSPRAGLAAVRHHHVMYIEASAGAGLWLIRDYNSGGGLSRLHVRDVRGYVFVNPGGRMAGL